MVHLQHNAILRVTSHSSVQHTDIQFYSSLGHIHQNTTFKDNWSGFSTTWVSFLSPTNGVTARNVPNILFVFYSAPNSVKMHYSYSAE